MSTKTVALETNLLIIFCASCGQPFGMTEDFDSRRRRDGAAFYCPSGHSNLYTRQPNKSEAEAVQLRERIAHLEQQFKMERATHETAVRSERIKRGKAEAKLKRTVTRVNAGVCPHCNRTFRQLSQHMRSKHPDDAGVHEHGT